VDIATPKRVSAPMLLVAALSSALGADEEGLLKTRIDEVLKHLCMSGEQERVPLPTLYADRRAGHNSLGTFLARPGTPSIAEKVEFNGTRILTEEGKDRIRDQVISQLMENPTSPENWGMVQLLGFEWLPAKEAAVVQGVVKSMSVPNAISREFTALIGHTVSAILPYCDANAREAFEARVLEKAAKLASTFDVPVIDIHADTSSADAAGLLVEFAVSLARTNEMSATVARLGLECKKLAAAWPALSAPLRTLLDRVLREFPREHGEEAWSSLVSLRAMV
jgi:hypothetical protein